MHSQLSEKVQKITQNWNTNWFNSNVNFAEIVGGGPPRDGIPSIDWPKFISIAEAESWLVGNEPVISVEINGEVRAYPLQILTWHEIVNDVVGGKKVAITFCPLCNSALVFDCEVEGQLLDFGVSGLLRNSDMIMYDRQTETLWQQMTGEAIIGELCGLQLQFVPSSIISFTDFSLSYSNGVVLSRDTGFEREYGRNPYVGYDTIGNTPFLFKSETDKRLPAMARVVTVRLGIVDVAYPVQDLTRLGVIHDCQGGQDLVVFHLAGTSSALDTQLIADGRDVGATGVYAPYVGGEKLSFKKIGGKILDNESGSEWDISGLAVAGPKAGMRLQSIVHGDHFWFSWAAFKPKTIVYEASNNLFAF